MIRTIKNEKYFSDFVDKIYDQLSLNRHRQENICNKIQRQLKRLPRHADRPFLVFDDVTMRFGITSIDKAGVPSYRQCTYSSCARIDEDQLVWELAEDAIEVTIAHAPVLRELELERKELEQILHAVCGEYFDPFGSVDEDEEEMRRNVEAARKEMPIIQAQMDAEFEEAMNMDPEGTLRAMGVNSKRKIEKAIKEHLARTGRSM